MSATRSDVVLFSKSLVGLSADPSDALTRQVYSDLIAPGETHARRAEMMTRSGCALVARGILRHFILHPLLERPYRTGDAMADLVAIAREAGALHGHERDPQPGDMVIVGGGAGGGGPEHAWTCLDVVGDPYDAGNGLLVTGLDGGQRDDAGLECIRVVERELRGGVDHTDRESRVVRWVVNVGDVVRRFGRV